MLAIAMALLVGAVQVEGTTVCPDPAQVQRLVDAQPAAGGSGRLRRVRLESSDAGVDVVGLDASGARVMRRSLETTSGCADRAYAVSVLIAAWESELALDLQVPRVPQVSSAPQALTAPDAGLSARAGTHGAEISVGLGAITTSGQAAPSATASVAFIQPGDVAGLRFSVSSQLPYRLRLGAGRADWGRHVLGIGFAARTPAASYLEFDGEIGLALVTARGSGYAVSKTDSDFDKGLGLGLRYVRAFGTWRAWAEVTGRLWLAGEEVRAGAASAKIAPLELGVRAGLLFGG